MFKNQTTFVLFNYSMTLFKKTVFQRVPFFVQKATVRHKKCIKTESAF